mmetsp:Transcript_11722/g.37175  ORF Transcript_11722/g.37175 Transcript_11722/m.37175 type:complete len:332 (-) Transcript_11722:661-1656(-)
MATEKSSLKSSQESPPPKNKDDSAGQSEEPASTVSVVLVCLVILGFLAGLAYAGSTNGIKIDGIPIFAYSIIVVTAIQVLVAIPSIIYQTEHYYDLTGSLTYLGVTILTLVLTLTKTQTATPQLSIAIAICIWAARLGSMLFKRVRETGKDGRFDDIKVRPVEFFRVWLLQALWISFTAGAGWAALSGVRATSQAVEIGLVVGGMVVWLVGFGSEAVADAQKKAFRRDSSNKGRFITTGLWSVSRHPNYAGEITLWLGIAIASVPYLRGAQFVTLISPLFVFLLIRFVSGVPMLEEKGEERWGEEDAWQRYVREVPVLFPTPASIARGLTS